MTTHIHKYVSDGIRAAILDAQYDGALPSGINVESITVRYPEKGGALFDTNAAFVIGKQIQKTPLATGLILIPYVSKIEGVNNVIILKNGFITFDINDGIWYEEIKKLVSSGLSYGNSLIGNNEKVNIEYVSANPTGPLHIGHARGAVFGDALASLLKKVGYDVTKEYYINDVGAQVDKLSRTLMHRYKEALGYTIGEIPEGLYPGDYMIQIANHTAITDGDIYLYMDIDLALNEMKDIAISMNMIHINEDLESLGIFFDSFVSEYDIHTLGSFKSAMDLIEQRGLTYTGRLPPPKSGNSDDWEDSELLLFKSTQMGDDVDRPLKKSDGKWTYFASDIAYHHDKFNRGFKKMINVWGADHGGYVKRMNAAVSAVTNDQGSLTTKLCQIVHFVKDGNPYVLSKRNGTYITLKDLIDEVGPDVVRFTFLTRKNDSQFTFDMNKVVEKSKDNPVWYIQYSHARTCSVLDAAMKAGLNINDNVEAFDFIDTLLTNDHELNIIRKLAAWPYIIEMSARELEPHRISTYMYELSGMFHSYWTAGNKNPDLRIIDSNHIHRSYARLLLVNAINIIIHSGLRIFGVTPLHEM